MKDMKITCENGRIITIKDYETYTVIYTTKAHPFQFQVVTNLYLNYPNDDHIGQDNEEGNGPWSKRIYFDNAEASHREGKNIIAVFTTQEWQMKLREIIK